MTIIELHARRRQNRRQMQTATGEMLELCQRLEDVLAALIFKLTPRASRPLCPREAAGILYNHEGSPVVSNGGGALAKAADARHSVIALDLAIRVDC